MNPGANLIVIFHCIAIVFNIFGFKNALKFKHKKLQFPLAMINAYNIFVQIAFIVAVTSNILAFWWISVVFGILQLACAIRLDAHILELFAFLSPKITNKLISQVKLAPYVFVMVGVVVYTISIILDYLQMHAWYYFFVIYFRRPYVAVFGFGASAYDCTQNIFLCRKIHDALKSRTGSLLDMKKRAIRILLTNVALEIVGVALYLVFLFGGDYYFSLACIVAAGIHAFNLTSLLGNLQDLTTARLHEEFGTITPACTSISVSHDASPSIHMVTVKYVNYDVSIPSPKYDLSDFGPSDRRFTFSAREPSTIGKQYLDHLSTKPYDSDATIPHI
jgi:hypothetical protein